MLKMSGTHHIPQVKNIPYQPLLIKTVFSLLAHAEKTVYFPNQSSKFFRKTLETLEIFKNILECFLRFFESFRKILKNLSTGEDTEKLSLGSRCDFVFMNFRCGVCFGKTVLAIWFLVHRPQSAADMVPILKWSSRDSMSYRR